jgi:hypothetical protein
VVVATLNVFEFASTILHSDEGLALVFEKDCSAHFYFYCRFIRLAALSCEVLMNLLGFVALNNKCYMFAMRLSAASSHVPHEF